MPESILVVEDTEAMREVVIDFLHLQGYECVGASDGEEGLRLLDEANYDLIITDLRLPKFDGFDIIEKANTMMPDVPKIIMTGYSDMDDAIRAVKLGAYDFLRKPLGKLDELGFVAQRALAHGRLVRERQTHLKQIEQMNDELERLNNNLENEVQSRTEDLRAANSQLRTLDEMKNNLLANISHELRTPLVSVRGYTELFYHGHMGEMPDGSKRYLETCLRNIDKLLALIDSLVRYAELVRDQAPMNLEAVDLNSVIQAQMDKFHDRAADKEIDISCEMLPGKVMVHADKERLESVFDNLIDNAIKFNPEKTSILIRLEKAGKWLIKTSVIDDGIGIPESEQPKVFDRFYQCDSGPTRRHGGTGIGLAIVRDNMRLMGSEVRLSAVEGHGSTFYWTMPIIRN